MILMKISSVVLELYDTIKITFSDLSWEPQDLQNSVLDRTRVSFSCLGFSPSEILCAPINTRLAPRCTRKSRLHRTSLRDYYVCPTVTTAEMYMHRISYLPHTKLYGNPFSISRVVMCG
jgi:hypothetical protein